MYEYVSKAANVHTVKELCETLSVNESGYYRRKRSVGKQSKREILSVEIIKIIEEDENNNNYGIKRVLNALKLKGINVGKRTVYRAMSELGLIHKRRKPKGITKADTETQEKENIIKRNFNADKPMEKCLTDITEVQTKDGKIYVSPMFDCYDGGIIALQIDSNMRAELCIKTVRQALTKKNGGIIIHSDRGSQYTSEAYRKELQKYGAIQSLSGTGHCYDNARMESFFATLKKELLYKIPTYKMSKEEVTRAIYRYIFGYYNTKRINSFNPGGLPPMEYRKLYYKKEATKAA